MFRFILYPCNSYYLSRIHHSQRKAEVVKLTYRIVIEKIHGSLHETTKHVTMKGFRSNYSHGIEQLNAE